MRRVVVTGIGLVTPLANGREASWSRLIEGRSGAGLIDTFDTSNVPCKIAFQVPWISGRGGGEGDEHAFDPDKVASAKERRVHSLRHGSGRRGRRRFGLGPGNRP